MIRTSPEPLTPVEAELRRQARRRAAVIGIILLVLLAILALRRES